MIEATADECCWVVDGVTWCAGGMTRAELTADGRPALALIAAVLPESWDTGE